MIPSGSCRPTTLVDRFAELNRYHSVSDASYQAAVSTAYVSVAGSRRNLCCYVIVDFNAANLTVLESL